MSNRCLIRFQQSLRHIYINPLEACNLSCAMCYTRKTTPILSDGQILQFIEKYQKAMPVETVTLCGGEVFLLPYISHLVNTITDKGIFVQIITNGTIDRLGELKNPNVINMIVSIDGLQKYHDANRGKGMFQKSVAFLKKAKSLGFHTEIFSIVTKQNYAHMSEFESFIREELNSQNSSFLELKKPLRQPADREWEITYHPRKPRAYLNNHPISNVFGQTKGFDFLGKKEIKKLLETKKTFPPKNLGCYQISLMSSGVVYGCCEGIVPIGTIRDNPQTLIENLKKRIAGPCLGCSEPSFACGMKEYFK